jgi:hypothetical protein
LSNRCFPEVALRFEAVVRPAPELQVASVRRPAGGIRDDVMKLEEAGLGTPAVGANKRAPSFVALPNLALDRCRHVTLSFPLILLAARLAWPVREPQPRALKLSDEGPHRTVEDECHIATRDGVPQQIASELQPVVRPAIDCDPDEISLG